MRTRKKFIEDEWVDVPFTPEEEAEADADELNLFHDIFIENLKVYRDAYWSNSTITLSNGAVLKVNDRTRRDISDVYNGLLSMGQEEYEGWNADNGIYTMTVADFQEAMMKGLMEVKKAFDAYNAVIDQHNNTPFTSWEDAKAAFDMEV